MQAELISQKNQTVIMLKKTNYAFVNTLRRLILEEVPTMAIDIVEFRKNSSVLYDEIIAHRLGLIPLKTDLVSYNLPSECTCKGEGCAKCQLKLTLKAKGPKTVYSSELKSKDPKVVPAIENIPIVKLLKDQELELEATAILGKGKHHAKFTPALVFYKNKPIVKIERNPENAELIEKKCPAKVFESKTGKLKVLKEDDCILCQECVELSNGCVKIEPNKNEFIFTIEPWGQLQVKDIIQSAIDQLNKKLDLLDKKIKEL